MTIAFQIAVRYKEDDSDVKSFHKETLQYSSLVVYANKVFVTIEDQIGLYLRCYFHFVSSV